MLSLTSIYLIVTSILFAFTLNEQMAKSQGYFPAIVAYLSDQNCVFILYNAIFSLAISCFKLFVWIFFQDTMEGEIIKITDCLKLKLFDIVFFSYIIQLNFGMQVYMVLILVILIYVIHEHLIFRSEYLVHVHSTSTALGLHYRALSLYILLFFLDYEILKLTAPNILSVTDEGEAMFFYYIFSISASLAEPFMQFGVDFYEKYTFTHFKNSDEFLTTAGLIINIPRLVVQLLISLWISYRFQIPFFFIISGLDNLSQIKKTIESYGRIKRLTKTMHQLRKVSGDQMADFHDLTCTVCYEDMKEAVLLPCKHIFHEECIRQWIIKNLNHFCPKCKQEFNFDKIEQQYEMDNRAQREPVAEFRNYLDQPQRRDQQPRYQNRSPQNRPFQDNRERFREQQGESSYNPMRNWKEEQSQLSFKKERPRFAQQEDAQVVNLRNGKVYPARQYIIDRPNLSDYPLEVYQQMKRKVISVGSLPFGMPSLAVANRSHDHMLKRKEYSRQLQMILRLVNMNRNQQLLFL